ncbi:hypothetical protein [Kitasatospora sp. NPDC092286]|uniref:hypothetical protein n=1 Tax=Kitasatospora sp. NPDC092286 TaxID=3364087 RepID=UPI00382D4B4D
MTDSREDPGGSAPGAGANSGVVVTGGSTVYGPVAGGRGATVWIGAGAGAPAGGPAGPEGLLTAARSLRAALARLRDERPGAVPEEDAADADAALAEILEEAALEQPRESRLRRRVGAVVDALRTVALLAAAVAGLESAFAALVAQG